MGVSDVSVMNAGLKYLNILKGSMPHLRLAHGGEERRLINVRISYCARRSDEF